MIYLSSVFKIPTLVTQKIDQICRNFIWTRVEDKKILSQVAWEKVCRKKKEGGLGIRRIPWMNRALRMKLVCWLVEGRENQ